MRTLLLCILVTSACGRRPLVDSTECGVVEGGFDEDVQGDAVDRSIPVRVVSLEGSEAPVHQPFVTTVTISADAGGVGYSRPVSQLPSCLSGLLVGQEAEVDVVVQFDGEDLLLSTSREDVSTAAAAVERFQDGSAGMGVELSLTWDLDEAPQALRSKLTEPEPPWEYQHVFAFLSLRTGLPGEPLDGILGIGVQRRADELGQQSDYLMSSTLEPVEE